MLPERRRTRMFRQTAREKAWRWKASAGAAERERIAALPMVYPSVPYARKDEAKSIGAKWEPAEPGGCRRMTETA